MTVETLIFAFQTHAEKHKDSGYASHNFRQYCHASHSHLLCSQMRLMNIVRRFLIGENAQDLVEWSLLLSLVVLGSAGVMYNSGTSVLPVWNATNSALAGNVQTTPANNSSTNTGTGTVTSGGSSGTSTHDEDRFRQ